jgi:hypothetical protein
MIIDCDTHLMPREAFDGVDGEFGPRKPSLKFNNDGLYVDVEFPGYPPEVPGTSPLLAPGSGAMFKSLWDVQSRMADYDNRLGIEQHVVLPQFSGWWSYLIEVEFGRSNGAVAQRSFAPSHERIPRTYLGCGSGCAAGCHGFDPRNGVGAGEWLLLGRIG